MQVYPNDDPDTAAAKVAKEHKFFVDSNGKEKDNPKKKIVTTINIQGWVRVNFMNL